MAMKIGFKKVWVKLDEIGKLAVYLGDDDGNNLERIGYETWWEVCSAKGYNPSRPTPIEFWPANAIRNNL